MREDILELTFLGPANLQTVRVKLGTLEVASEHLSYVHADDADHDPPARTYIPLARLERFRYQNRNG
jgi:hypothetical protein